MFNTEDKSSKNVPCDISIKWSDLLMAYTVSLWRLGLPDVLSETLWEHFGWMPFLTPSDSLECWRVSIWIHWVKIQHLDHWITDATLYFTDFVWNWNTCEQKITMVEFINDFKCTSSKFVSFPHDDWKTSCHQIWYLWKWPRGTPMWLWF